MKSWQMADDRWSKAENDRVRRRAETSEMDSGGTRFRSHPATKDALEPCEYD